MTPFWTGLGNKLNTARRTEEKCSWIEANGGVKQGLSAITSAGVFSRRGPLPAQPQTKEDTENLVKGDSF